MAPLRSWADAAPREDLTWLRRRTLRPTRGRAQVVTAGRGGTVAADGGSRTTSGSRTTGSPTTSTDRSAGAPGTGPRTPSGRIDLTRPGRTGAPARPVTPAATGATAAAPAAAATGGTSLDLSSPEAPPTAPSAPAPPATPAPPRTPPARTPTPAAGTPDPLDLSAPGTTSAAAGTTSAAADPLDLSRPPAPSRATPHHAPARVRRPRPSAARGDLVLGYEPVPVRPGRPVTLDAATPTVALTRVQSGVGGLSVRAAVSPAVGDLHLATAVTLRSGDSMLVAHGRGVRQWPTRGARPVVVSSRGEHERVVVDLRKVTQLRRLVVLAFSPSGASLSWGGTLLVETAGGGRVDVPLDRAPAPGVLAALSVHVVDGRLVLRAENGLVPGALRDACLAYGFRGITWVDPSTPLV